MELAFYSPALKIKCHEICIDTSICPSVLYIHLCRVRGSWSLSQCALCDWQHTQIHLHTSTAEGRYACPWNVYNVSPITWLLIQCMWLSFLSKSDVCFRNQADNHARVLHRATRTQWDDISHLGRNLQSLLSLFSAVVHPQPNQIICPQQWCVLLYSVAANSF